MQAINPHIYFAIIDDINLINIREKIHLIQNAAVIRLNSKLFMFKYDAIQTPAFDFLIYLN
jgi:hypothetical protein